MIKARFIEEQPKVKVTERDGMYYIFICLNGEWKEQIEEIDGETVTTKYWECDFNEIITDEIDIEDVENNPEDYIDYTVKHVDPDEQLRADVDYLLLLSEV